MWGFYQSLLKRRLVERLARAFTTSGLQNKLGKLPKFVSDKGVDPFTRKLRVTRAHYPLKEFENAKSALESSLNIYIDEFRENRPFGTIDITYAHKPMPSQIPFDISGDFGTSKFVIGRTRSERVMCDFSKVPHLLIAGQTGGGKSTFLRQLITTLIIKIKNVDLILVDLKGGLEFQLFEGLSNVRVVSDRKQALYRLQKADEALNVRMAQIKSAKVQDIDSYNQVIKDQPQVSSKKLSRQFIVVDEAAEIFLAGGDNSSKDVQTTKAVLSRIARQGRAVGIHLVLATQRPDRQTVDSQVKANLTGVLCFQMPNDASSITVLGNGRATDLPPIAGRAIWKTGIEQIEIQTPFLSLEDAKAKLADLPKSDHVEEVSDKLPPIQGKKKQQANFLDGDIFGGT